MAPNNTHTYTFSGTFYRYGFWFPKDTIIPHTLNDRRFIQLPDGRLFLNLYEPYARRNKSYLVWLPDYAPFKIFGDISYSLDSSGALYRPVEKRAKPSQAYLDKLPERCNDFKRGLQDLMDLPDKLDRGPIILIIPFLVRTAKTVFGEANSVTCILRIEYDSKFTNYEVLLKVDVFPDDKACELIGEHINPFFPLVTHDEKNGWSRFTCSEWDSENFSVRLAVYQSLVKKGVVGSDDYPELKMMDYIRSAKK